MKRDTIIFSSIMGIIVFYIGDRVGEIYHNCAATDFSSKLNAVNDNLHLLYEVIYISLDFNDILWGILGVVFCGLFILYQVTNHKNRMPGIEHGSAKWGDKSDIAKMVDKKYENNILLTQTERMSINTRQTMRNNNILVVGGSGTGKTRFFVKPSFMQMHSSYVATDPKGSILEECGKMLYDNGYVIKTINLVNFEKSMHYNPFEYIKDEKDILTLSDLIIKNCGDKSEKQDFWVKAERLLYSALISYIMAKFPKDEQNFHSLLKLLNQMVAKEENENFKSGIDVMFENLEKEDENHFAVLQYKKYKMAAGKTAKSILISCGVRLAPFEVKEIREITESDDMSLGRIGEEKTALFIIIDDTNSTYNFLASFLYTQLFSTLIHKADKEYKGRLPIHVRCLLDEFANIGQIPDFEKIIATIRSREISAAIILQNMSQLEALYDKQAGTIAGCCDTTLFLGSSEEKTTKWISEKVGKTTIDHSSTSVRKQGMAGGDNTRSDQIIGRELITAAEVGLLPRDTCLLFINGIKPFKSKKFKIEGHKQYKCLADYDKANYFDINEYKKEIEAQAEKAAEEIEQL